MTKTIRLNAEDAEMVMNLIKAEDLTWSGAIHRLINEGVPSKQEIRRTDEEVKMEKDMISMARYFNVSYLELLRKIWNGLHDGFLTIDGDMVVGIPGLQLDELYDACHEAGVDPQRAINKFVKDMRKK